MKSFTYTASRRLGGGAALGLQRLARRLGAPRNPES
jgi:hypothetical protein